MIPSSSNVRMDKEDRTINKEEEVGRHPSLSLSNNMNKSPVMEPITSASASASNISMKVGMLPTTKYQTTDNNKEPTTEPTQLKLILAMVLALVPPSLSSPPPNNSLLPNVFDRKNNNSSVFSLVFSLVLQQTYNQLSESALTLTQALTPLSSQLPPLSFLLSDQSVSLASSLLLPSIKMAPSSLSIQNEIFLNHYNILNNNNNDAWIENNENISLFLMHGKKKSQILETIHGTKYCNNKSN